MYPAGPPPMMITSRTSLTDRSSGQSVSPLTSGAANSENASMAVDVPRLTQRRRRPRRSASSVVCSGSTSSGARRATGSGARPAGSRAARSRRSRAARSACAWTSTWRSSEPTVSLYASTAPSSDRPSFDDVRAHGREPLVQLAAELARPLARSRRPSPAATSCATARSRIDQRARRGEDHVRAPCVLLERRVVLVCRAQVRLVREEHDDEVGRRLELAPVAPSPRASRRVRAPGARGRRDGRSRSASSDVSKASR